MTSGFPTRNLPAVATCAEREWGVGTVLWSESWAHPRRVEGFKGTFVFLRSVPPVAERTPTPRRKDGTFIAKHEKPPSYKNTTHCGRVRSFPPDVRRYHTDT